MSRHVADQLPLWVEGDLDARETATVEAHLAICPVCRAEAESLRESQAWLKEGDPAPFTAEDRAALRREVLARLAPPRASGFRLAWWTAATLAAASLLLLLDRSPGAIPASPLPPPSLRTAAASPEAPPNTPAPTPVRVARHRPGAPRPDPEAVLSSVSRIEIQTDNPRIRIIWLARAARPEGSPRPDQEDL